MNSETKVIFKRWLGKILVGILVLCGAVVGCAAGDPLPGDLYTRNVYPGTGGAFSIGSPGLPYLDGFFATLYPDALQFYPPTELTISAGNITVTQSYHTVDTEGGASTDDLDNINGGLEGDILILRPSNTTRDVVVRHGIGNIRLEPQLSFRSYGFISPAGGFGTFYAGGYYMVSATDANLTQLATTQTFGSVNTSHASYVILVAAGAGVTDAGTVSIVVSGTSITDEGVRTAGDSETIVSDITAMSTNDFFETSKKWLGQVTYTLTPSGATAYSADFNYGFAKYDDWGNRDFVLREFEVVGRAGANDNGFNVRLIHHTATGWIYHPAAFSPGGTVLTDMNVDQAPDVDLVVGEQFSYKRTNLVTVIEGDGNEGFVVEVTTSANKAIERMDIIIGAGASDDIYMRSIEHAVMLIYDGVNWLEL